MSLDKTNLLENSLDYLRQQNNQNLYVAIDDPREGRFNRTKCKRKGNST